MQCGVIGGGRRWGCEKPARLLYQAITTKPTRMRERTEMVVQRPTAVGLARHLSGPGFYRVWTSGGLASRDETGDVNLRWTSSCIYLYDVPSTHSMMSCAPACC